ncbi:piggyBac transposable element-derived protein 4 [Trichonephila clavipes]|nr:piggyBac transposable element-derived protein 4 [Trichonephila clavipes]
MFSYLDVPSNDELNNKINGIEQFVDNLMLKKSCATAPNPAIMTFVNRTKKDGTKEEVPCPKAVAVYNDVMGGADRFDQRKERYQIRRSVK